MIINKEEIQEFLDKCDYDIRKSKNGRWFDQKCTPDIINSVADCILHYIEEDKEKKFTIKNIWHSKYSEAHFTEIYNKPSVKNPKAKKEYDKIFGQPIKMFANAKILHEEKKGRVNCYHIIDYDILEYISLREKYSLNFISMYIEKVMKDSDMWEEFKKFFETQNNTSYSRLKNKYSEFIKDNTSIDKKNEINRIFTKVLNPLAYEYQKFGSDSGNISRNNITYSSLMYNQENFRDYDKPKNMTRQEWDSQISSKPKKEFITYQVKKAKEFIRKFNDNFNKSQSEFNDDFSKGKATNMHHIFMQSEYPEISMYYENITALTPTQHTNCAHPDSHTSHVSLLYQEFLLINKAFKIKENIDDESVDTIYDFDKFIEVLNIGFNEDHDIKENHFNESLKIIINYYKKQ
jgi:hypothetical protein